MAGMEIFGWSTFLLSCILVLGFKSVPGEISPKELKDYLPWKACVALLIITIIGNLVNGTPETDKIYSIGSHRWILLFFAISYMLAIFPPSIKGYRVFLVFCAITAVYAAAQAFTGYDFLRPGSNRAVWPLGMSKESPIWRSSGWFGSPLQYGYNAGMYACIALSCASVYFEERRKSRWMFWGSLFVFLLVALSVITTFTRGAWIALALASLSIVFLAIPKMAAAVTGSGALFLSLLFAFQENFRIRVLSIFAMDYSSNSERLFLWRANWEMFKDYPIFGIGYQQNEARAGEYVARLGSPNSFTGHAHNNYLQMLAGTGITGFLSYMFIIGFMLWLNWRLIKHIPKDLLWPRALAIGCLGAQILLHVGGLTECNFKTGTTNHNFMIVWSLVVSMSALDARGWLRERYHQSII